MKMNCSHLMLDICTSMIDDLTCMHTDTCKLQHLSYSYIHQLFVVLLTVPFIHGVLPEISECLASYLLVNT